MKKDYSVYIVQCKDRTLYTGIAKDVQARIKMHNAGRGARYTRTHGPVKLVHSEGPYTCGDALKRERAIKKLKKPMKLKLIKSKKKPTTKALCKIIHS